MFCDMIILKELIIFNNMKQVYFLSSDVWRWGACGIGRQKGEGWYEEIVLLCGKIYSEK